MIVDIQFNQGSAPWSHLRDAAVLAEDVGFSTVWNLDHFSGALFNSDTMMECFTCLTAWATVTQRIKLGTLVANINNRSAGLLANIVSSLQEISNGRCVLGLGAGASPTSPYANEQRALKAEVLPTMAQRHERLCDNVDAMMAIWAADRNESFAGFPRPSVVPPIIVGVNSVELARISGERFDGINTRWNHPQRRALIAAAHEQAANKPDFDVSVWCPFVPEYADPSHPLHQELLADGVNRLIMFDASAPNVELIEATRQYVTT